MVEIFILFHLITPILGLVFLAMHRETQRKKRLLRMAIEATMMRRY